MDEKPDITQRQQSYHKICSRYDYCNL